MNIATFGSQKLNPSIICCQHYIYVWNLIFINFSRIRASVPLNKIASLGLGAISACHSAGPENFVAVSRHPASVMQGKGRVIQL